MTVYRDIPNAEIAPDADALSITAIALRDNLFSVIEGDATAIAAGKQIATAAIADGAVTPAKMANAWTTKVFTGAVAAGNIVLDVVEDWRDRFITAQGIGAWFVSLARAQEFIPGAIAGEDEKIYTAYLYDSKAATLGQSIGADSHQTGQITLFNSQMYSRAGGANQTVLPRIAATISTDDGNALFAIWINSANGSLNLYMQNTGASCDFVAYNFVIGFGPDQNHY